MFVRLLSMIRLMVSLLGIGFIIACPLRVEAQLTAGLSQLTPSLPLEVRVIDETKTLDKDKINNSTTVGQVKNFENSYSAELRYTPLEGSIDGIKLRLISFFIPYDWEKKRIDPKPGKIQVRENISLQANETKKIEFEPETYKKGAARSDTLTTVTLYHIGQEYAGVVLEVYRNDVLIGTRFDGVGELRRFYENWLEKDSPKLAQPKNQGGPVLDKGTAQAPPGFFTPQNQDSGTPSGSGTKPAQPKKKQGGPVLIKPPGF